MTTDEALGARGMDLVGMTERECEVFLAGMLSGYLEGEAVGYARGRGAAEADEQQLLEDTPEGPWTWATPSAAARRDLFEELRDWVDWAIVRYELRGQNAIRPCWHRHPVAVEELTAVFVAWRAANARSKRVPHDGLISWHDRWWWPCLRRLHEQAVFSDCATADTPPPAPSTPSRVTIPQRRRIVRPAAGLGADGAVTRICASGVLKEEHTNGTGARRGSWAATRTTISTYTITRTP